jgi:hypothetical protein
MLSRGAFLLLLGLALVVLAATSALRQRRFLESEAELVDTATSEHGAGGKAEPVESAMSVDPPAAGNPFVVVPAVAGVALSFFGTFLRLQTQLVPVSAERSAAAPPREEAAGKAAGSFVPARHRGRALAGLLRRSQALQAERGSS